MLTGLMLSSGNGFDNEVLDYLRIGTNTEETDDDGDTALVYAASNGHVTTVELLLAHGANPNIAASQPLLPMIARRALMGEPALPHVSTSTWRQVLNSLLKAGGSPDHLYINYFALGTPDGSLITRADAVGYLIALDVNDLTLGYVASEEMRSRLGMI